MTEKRIVGAAYVSQFLFDSGLLYEINRTVLHPLGISLAVALQDGSATCTEDIIIKIDDDYEGYVFGPDPIGHVKLTAFHKSIHPVQRAAARMAALGFIVQPHPDNRGEKDG